MQATAIMFNNRHCYLKQAMSQCRKEGAVCRSIKNNVLINVAERYSGRPRRRWEDNIKMDLRKMWLEDDSSGSGQRPFAGYCETGNEPWGCIRGGEFHD
jgi:hypothetical protein